MVLSRHRLSRISPTNLKISSPRAFQSGTSNSRVGFVPDTRNSRSRISTTSEPIPEDHDVVKSLTEFLEQNEFDGRPIWLRFFRETTKKTLAKNDALFRKRVEKSTEERDRATWREV
ncbi:hypothetical protein WN51_03538 [Melipona quadrifasciata]|uniref:Uncharacterized protein n=1 Tax=Melipona quadrifasciata TaxID=166423 RepID=A0A0M8ZU52_9HYME|nr:hypothetical protein WN51_03538 [Melipona quadrifasciata]